jgi:hypothetical protein
MVEAWASTSGMERPAEEHFASIEPRSSSVSPPISSRPFTKSRKPASVGMRPAEVCGWAISPARSNSTISLRIVAELNGSA